LTNGLELYCPLKQGENTSLTLKGMQSQRRQRQLTECDSPVLFLVISCQWKIRLN